MSNDSTIMNSPKSQPLSAQISRNSSSSQISSGKLQKLGGSTRNFLSKVKDKLATPLLEENDQEVGSNHGKSGSELDNLINPVSRSTSGGPSSTASSRSQSPYYKVSSSDNYSVNNTTPTPTPNPLLSSRANSSGHLLNRLIQTTSQSSLECVNEPPKKPNKRTFKSLLSRSRVDAAESITVSDTDRYLTELKTWELTLKLNKDRNASDPLIYARERLTSFIDTYDLILMNQFKRSDAQPSLLLPPGKLVKELKFKDPVLSDQIDLLGFWSISALLAVSDADNFITNKLLKDFANYDLKNNERMKIFNVQGEFFGLQWAWQLGLDNPNADVYDVSTQPGLPLKFKNLVGPSNIISIDGERLENLSFEDNFFTLAMSYDSWLHLKKDEWDPMIKEMYRVLAPPGFIHFFICDFDIFGCQNPKYRDFFKRVQHVLIKNGMDPYPSRHLSQHLKDAGFVNIRYSCLAMRKGIPNSMGNMTDFIQGYLELIIFDKIANLEMSAEDTQQFRELKMDYHNSLRNGELINDFGSGYLRLNDEKEEDDPLWYAQQRLISFCDTYRMILRRFEKTRSYSDSSYSSDYSDFSVNSNPNQDIQTMIKQPSLYTSSSSVPIVKDYNISPDLAERLDHIGFWSIEALKLLTGLDKYFAQTAFKNFDNFHLKPDEKLRVLNTQIEYFGQQWSWQLALDNPSSVVYDILIRPKAQVPPGMRSRFTEPENLLPIPIHSLLEIPFADNWFAFAVYFELWLQLKENEWVPVLKEIHRVITPPGKLYLFLYDFDLVNCQNVKLRAIYDKLHKILIKKGIDIHPTRHIQQRLKEAGFNHIRYTCISLKQGIPSPMGNLMDFVQSFFELIIFDKIANFEMDQEDLGNFKEIKLQYQESMKSGMTLNEMGSAV
ncbi:hypothetical protein WICPIJ_005383, partial [Wickerhamomyces pijperi]